MRKAFTLVEIMATVTIMAILAGMAFVYIPNYAARTSAIVNTQNIAALNTALENYKVQGGMDYAHSLAGPNLNTVAGNAAIFSALKEGFTLHDVHLRFVDDRFELSPNSVKAINSGTKLYFEAGTPNP